MYAFILVLLVLFYIWHSRRSPPVYIEPPIIPDLTNPINTPTDMNLVIPVAAVDGGLPPVTSVDNSLTPVTPPIGPSVPVPDMSGTDVMNVPIDNNLSQKTDPSTPEVTTAETAGEITEEEIPPQLSSICICRRWNTNKNRCAAKPNISGHLVHQTVGDVVCPDPACKPKVMGIHNYARFFPGARIPDLVKKSGNNKFGMCKCSRSGGKCMKNKRRCVLTSSDPCLWPQCVKHVSNPQLKLEYTAISKLSTYNMVSLNSKNIYGTRNAARTALEKAKVNAAKMVENLRTAELKFNEADIKEKELKAKLEAAKGEPPIVITPLQALHSTAVAISNSSYSTYMTRKKIVENYNKALTDAESRLATAEKAVVDYNIRLQKATDEAQAAHVAAYGSTSPSIIASIKSAFSSFISGFRGR